MDEKKHIYFMPGLAASSRIFEYVDLDPSKYQCHYLEWMLPDKADENLSSYVKRLAERICHEDVILVGVSFGGIIVQELNKIINASKVIIISSIKNERELPKRLKFLKYTWAYKLLPAKRISNNKDLSDLGFNRTMKRKIELYNKYLSVRDQNYLNWAVRSMLFWKSKGEVQPIHIHGTKDEVFPIKHIQNCIAVEGGNHAMIIIKGKKIGAILENIISNDS